MLIMRSLFFINFYANKNVLSGITTTYMLQFETKENQKLTEIKNILQHIQVNGFKTTTDNILL